MTGTIDGLHHIAHVVADLGAARVAYERLGFSVPPPSYYALPGEGDDDVRYVGAANTHLTFTNNFVELICAVDPDVAVPADAKITPLQAPPELLEKMSAALGQAGTMIDDFLQRFPGVHILALHTPDVDEAASRLTAAGIGHGGVNATQRQVDTPDGPKAVATRFLELDGGDPTRPGLVAEGRIAVAESLAAELAHGGEHLTHPNAAVALDEVVLAVDPADLASTEKRYAAYLDAAASSFGKARVFHLERGQVALVPTDALADLVPGATVPPTPGYAAYAITVTDLDATTTYLADAGVGTDRTSAGELIVSGPEALGTTIIFRSAN